MEVAHRTDELIDQITDVSIFKGIDPAHIKVMLTCLDARERSFRAGQTVLRRGEPVAHMGIVLCGGLRIERADIAGNVHVLGYVGAGEIFAESYACCPGVPLLIDVIAAKDTQVLLLDVSRITHSCASACPHHAKLIANMLAAAARKNIELSRRVFHTMPRTIREKLNAYLSTEAARAGSASFTIPYNRQQLADYLGVDRSALSAELSRMQKEGLLATHRSRFELKR